MIRRLWPRSLQGQMLLAVALALLLAQGISAALTYRAQAERRESALLHTAAFRLFSATDDAPMTRRQAHGRRHPREVMEGVRSMRPERSPVSPLQEGDARVSGAEAELSDILAEQGVESAAVVVFHRQIENDPAALKRIAGINRKLGRRMPGRPDFVLVAGLQRQSGGEWLVVRVLAPGGGNRLLASLIGQTLLIYVVLVGAIALLLRRITRPLAALTGRVERFAETRDTAGQLVPEGPDDMRRLIIAHNAMEDRIAALLDEKDVMLGAIGHDLKTPLSALRVRIESVENEAERGKMAATIEDITRSLDDILSLARVGRPSDPLEPTELAALTAAVTEEFEDMGEPVTLEDSSRIVVALRATWLRRALRNLISNALRYGKVARVSLTQEAGNAVIRIADDGPGIPEADLDRMLEPFTRGDPSRNSQTGGAGLGLTLARAIAEQHGGSLSLANRRDGSGSVIGLTATLSLPLK